MQAAALAPRLRRAHDELGHLHQVAQLQQVARDMEVGVELVDLGGQQRDAVGRALQPLVGAHDAHVVPHEAAQLVPVVRDDHGLVGIGHAAVVPRRQRGTGAGRGFDDGLRGGAREHHAFDQRIAGQAVGAMQAGAGGLADGVEARHVGAAA